MKQVLFSLMLFVTTPLYAQPTVPRSINALSFNNPTLQDALQQITDAYKVEIATRESLKETLKLTANLPVGTPLNDALTVVLAGVNLDWAYDPNEKLVRITMLDHMTTPSQQIHPVYTPPITVNVMSRGIDMVYCGPHLGYRPAGTCTPQPPSTSWEIAGYNGYSGYIGGGYGYSPSTEDIISPCRSYMPRPEQNVNCVQGSVKFDTKADYLNDVIVRIDGSIRGKIGNYRHHIGKGLLLAADTEHEIELVRYLPNGKLQVWKDRITPESIRMSKGKDIWIPVSEETFSDGAYVIEVTPTRDEKMSGKQLVTGKQ